ncbi:MAG: ribosome maturation factor RimM [Thermodesulfobacteriota bacterium]
MKSSNDRSNTVTDKWIPVGKIVGVHGVRGSLKLKSFCEDPDIWNTRFQLSLQPKGLAPARFRIGAYRHHARIILIELEGIETREQAEQWIGAEVYLPREAFPEPEDGSHYWFDLIGLAVKAVDGRPIGEIRQLFSTGPQDVLVVQDEETEVLIPLVEAFVKQIDQAKRVVWVDLPADMPVERLRKSSSRANAVPPCIS